MFIFLLVGIIIVIHKQLKHQRKSDDKRVRILINIPEFQTKKSTNDTKNVDTLLKPYTRKPLILLGF